MINEDIGTATHWWTAERDSEGIPSTVATILPFLFQTLDALYITTRNFPSTWRAGKNLRVCQGGKENMIIEFPLTPKDYVLFRAALSFSSDVYFLAKSLMDSGDLLELNEPVIELYRSADKFRDIRNFYTHLNERITNLDVHGVGGEEITNCGIEYTAESADNFHLIISGNTIHFSQYKKSLEVGVGRDAFDQIFISARSIYSELITHKIHNKEYRDPEQLFPLTH